MAGLFKQFNPLSGLPANKFGLGESSQINRGSLISFHYPQSYAMIPNVIHDFYPMVIITDIWPDFIRGINLHYLTFPYVRTLISKFGGNGSFSWDVIKNDPYMANSFRMYARMGVKQPKRLDTEWLKTVLAEVRSFAPGEIEKIKATIQKQIQARLQVKANELTSYEEWRKQLTKSQQNQLRNKVSNINNAMIRGQQEDLIKPIPSDQEPIFNEYPEELI